MAVQKKPQNVVRSMSMSEEALAFVRMTTLLQIMRAVLRMFLFSRNIVRYSLTLRAVAGQSTLPPLQAKHLAIQHQVRPSKFRM